MMNAKSLLCRLSELVTITVIAQHCLFLLLQMSDDLLRYKNLKTCLTQYACCC